MIVELTVENLAIIERAQLSLGSGFTVLTGETGAGKSLLIDAIELALGERADTELVRSGARRASVHVVVDLSQDLDARQRCEELGIELDDCRLFIDRDVALEGRSQCRLGGKLTPVGILRSIGAILVDLHGQHSHQSLLDPTQHLSYIDAWIGEPARTLLREVAESFEVCENVRRKLSALQTGIREREHRLDLLRFQINEIESVAPRVGEMPELESQLSRMKNLEKLVSAAYSALESLGDQENCAIDLVGSSVKSLDGVSRFDSELDDVVQPIQEALVLLEDGVHSLRAYAESLDMDLGKLDEVANRIDSLRRLRRKYGEDEAQILEFLEQARSEVTILEDSEASEEELQTQLASSQNILLDRCKRLSEIRKSRADQFAKIVESELRDLAMERAVFGISIVDQEPTETGADLVEFLFSANAGEPPRPLAKIASGGEVSRVMLALKTALAGKAGVPTLIFDEVDSGLGGRAAATMGRKLEQLGEHYQVLVISHSPQIASRARDHLRIEKVEMNGRVVTQVRRLNDDERIDEIARMLAGEAITPSSIANARDLLGLTAL